MSYTNLLVANDGVRTITINRPDQLNALNRATIAELDQALNEAEADKGVRVLMLTGSGAKAFVAGADIKEFADFSVDEGKALSADGHKKLFDHVERLEQARDRRGERLRAGRRTGTCHELSLPRGQRQCAKLGLPEVGLGVIPGYGGTQRLAQLVGKGKALEMILLGSSGMIPAAEALQWGLVNHVVPADQLISTCMELAPAIAKQQPHRPGCRHPRGERRLRTRRRRPATRDRGVRQVLSAPRISRRARARSWRKGRRNSVSEPFVDIA
jgi:enoyl-CoA hydratase